jgi:hypothetical protein
MTHEEKEQWEKVAYRMDAEGFHYCFEKYSSFPEIKDAEFHSLRLSYLRAAKLLEEYVLTKSDEEVEDDEDDEEDND